MEHFWYGIVLGIIFINHTSNVEIKEVTTYVENLKENIKLNGNIDKISCFIESMKQNLRDYCFDLDTRF